MPNRSDFLVIGAQKCATSWLYYCLREHPELRLPAKKRDDVYLGGDLYEARGVDWYFGLMEPSAACQKKGSVSIEYLFDARSPVIHQHAPDVKLIVPLREPISRAISSYFWEMRKRMIPTLPLGEGLTRAVDEEGATESQNPEVRERYKAVINRGFYDLQLERYLEYFRPDQQPFSIDILSVWTRDWR